MKKIVLALIAAVSLMPAAAGAQSPETWTGMAITESVSPQCANYGADLTDTYDVSLQPQQVQQNPGPWANNGSFIGFYDSSEWFSFNLQGDLVPFNTPRPAWLSRVRRAGGAYQHFLQIERMGINPATFDASTKYITITMTVQNWRGASDCTVGLRLRLSKVPTEQQSNRARRGVVSEAAGR